MKSKIIRIKLTSENIGFGLTPADTDEVYQVLTIIQNGKIYFRSYQYGHHKLLRSKNLKFSPEKIDEILYQIEKIVNTPSYIPCFATDTGIWTIEIFYAAKKQEFSGSLINGGEFDQVSDELRSLTKIHDLFAFDGNTHWIA